PALENCRGRQLLFSVSFFLTRLQFVRCIQVALSAILTVVDVDSSTLYGLSHLGEWQCFLSRLLIRTQSPGPTLVSASQVLSPLIEACFQHGSILQHIF